MKTTEPSLWGKLQYGFIFMVILPALLIVWAKSAAPLVGLPAIQSTGWGLTLLAAGVGLMLNSMYLLWAVGKGLPMNAYPPLHFVRQGGYRLLPHPIYAGFVMVCVGLSIYDGSAAGLWLVSPTALLGCAALVWGYERPDLKARFQDISNAYLLAIPSDKTAAPRWQDRLSVYFCLLLPWVLLNALAVTVLGKGALPEPVFQLPDPGLPQTEHWIVALSTVTLVFAAPLLARTRHQLRQFFLNGLAGGSLVVYVAFIMPSIGLGHWTGLEADFWLKTVLSISWFWIWMATALLGQAYPVLKTASRWLAMVLTFGLVANSVDPVAHAITGAAGYLVAMYYPAIWEFLLEQSEKIANSWKEWVFGPVRVINHGFYAGASAFAGLMLASGLAGIDYVIAIVVFGIFGIVGAMLWGQFVEGSDKLKRPFGYYGCLVGAVFGCGVMYWMGISVWVMLALFSVILPWIQAIGRLRCLVNGCCHGALTEKTMGIRYTHPRSRVCYLAHLKGKPLHPTPLYSIAWMAIAGGLLLRLWTGGAAPSLITGGYLMLNGLGRFVEEAYRGEPQTKIVAGLRLYQWAAIASVLAGIGCTFFETAMPGLTPGLSWKALTWGIVMWGFTQFAMGIDFPKSNVRFSRLV
jgi:hypothetical protein